MSRLIRHIPAAFFSCATSAWRIPDNVRARLIHDDEISAVLAASMNPDLQTVYNSTKNYISRGMQEATRDPKARVSRFWRSIFTSRPALPNIDAARSFRRAEYTSGCNSELAIKGARSSAGNGNATRATTLRVVARWLPHLRSVAPDRSIVQLRYENFVRTALQHVPVEELASFSEPDFGEPEYYEFQDLTYSLSFLRKMVVACTLRDRIREYSKNTEVIDVCEIGPGWGGMASQLFQILDIHHYTICDLPGNLLYSSVFLQMATDRKATTYVRPGSGVSDFAKDSLAVSLPQYLDHIACKYDVVVNVASMQEMDAETVIAYMNWIHGHLVEDGIFFFVNTHGKAGINKASEYQFGRFCMKRFRPFWKVPAGFFNLIPYEVVLAKSPPGNYLDEHIDSLGCLFQLGLDANIHTLCDGMIACSLNETEMAFLHLVYEFFTARNINEKLLRLTAMKRLDVYKEVVLYLEGCVYLLKGRTRTAFNSLVAACDEGLDGFAGTIARTISLILYADLNTDESHAHVEKNFIHDIAQTAPGLEEEVRRIIKSRDIRRVKRMLRKRMILK